MPLGMLFVLVVLSIAVLPAFASTYRVLAWVTLGPGLLIAAGLALTLWQIDRHAGFGTAIAFGLFAAAAALLVSLSLSRLLGLWLQQHGGTRFMALGLDALFASLAVASLFAPSLYRTHLLQRPAPAACAHLLVEVGGETFRAPLEESVTIYPQDPYDAMYLLSPAHQRQACRTTQNGARGIEASALSLRTGTHASCRAPTLKFTAENCARDSWRKSAMILFDPDTVDHGFFHLRRRHPEDSWRNDLARCRPNSGARLGCSAVLSLGDGTQVFWEFSAAPGGEAEAFEMTRTTVLQTIVQLSGDG